MTADPARCASRPLPKLDRAAARVRKSLAGSLQDATTGPMLPWRIFMGTGRLLSVLLAVGSLATPIRAAQAEETEIVVRVISLGAKFVGTSMGGAQITLKDASTGEVLAKGVTQGSTGDTDRIMGPDRDPSQPLSTPDAASFRTKIDLSEPTRIEAEAFGPLGRRQSATRVSSVRWVVPGADLSEGDGWLLTLPGLAVDVRSPKVPSGSDSNQPIQIHADVRMMCGCPITKDGPWKVEEYRVEAVVTRQGEEIARVDLEYAGRASQFRAEYEPPEPGAYHIRVIAQQPRLGNTGVDLTAVTIFESP